MLGSGSWRSGTRKFTAGVHEVDEEVAVLARSAPPGKLLVLDEPPTLAQAVPGPLSAEDVKRGRRSGTYLPEPPETLEVRAEPAEIPNTYVCPYCDHPGFPHRGPLKRHVQLHHETHAAV